jgi:hypothetical protein
MTEAQFNCMPTATSDCKVVEEIDLATELPLVSSDPNCPIIDLKIMKDYGQAV